METISPWTIYWVLQLDTLISSAVVLSVFGGCCVFGLWVSILTESNSLAFRLLAVAASVVWLAVTSAAIFLPSTKTAAAMFVIPAIANNDTIQHEAGDLYSLAKQALRNAVTEKSVPDEAKP